VIPSDEVVACPIRSVGRFDWTFSRSIFATVPSGLSSLTLGFQALAIDASGRLVATAREEVELE
jgi:hypothetical protein